MQGAIGKGNISIDCGTATDCKKSNSGYKLLVGFEQGNGLAYEAQIISYGKVSAPGFKDYTASGFGGNVAYIGNFSDSFGYRVAGGLGLNKTDNNSGTSTTTAQLTLGGGLAYNISKTMAISMDYDLSTHKNGTGSNVTSGTATLLSFGLRAKF